ncbi:MAG: hypothetical protein Q8K66_05295 [Sediminibacterium sp.]|nr:hypothetical protein [Sediminibacterium sp.]
MQKGKSIITTLKKERGKNNKMHYFSSLKRDRKLPPEGWHLSAE